MSEAQPIVSGGQTSPPAAPAPLVSQPPAAQPAPLAADPAPAAVPPVGADPGQTPPSAPDWRALLAGDNQDYAKEIGRYNDPTEVAKALIESKKALRESGRVKVPGENATAEELTAWRQALGVPEKPEDYKIDVKPPAGLEIGDGDKAVLTQIQADLHKLGAPPAFVKYAHEMYFAQMAEASAQRLAAGQQIREQTEVALKQKWGREFDTNLGFANAAVTQFGMKDLLNERMESGALLGDHPVFAEVLAKIGRLNADDPYFLAASKGGSAKSPDDRKRELYALRQTDPQRYNSPEVQTELEAILRGQVRQQELRSA